MSDEHCIWLPFPPSANNIWRGNGQRTYLAPKYREWRAEAIVRIKACKIPKYTVPVVFKMELVPATSRPMDADNFNKPVLDALVMAGVLEDDNNQWVKAVLVWWENPAKTWGVKVTLRPAHNTRKPALNAGERAYLDKLSERGLILVGSEHRQAKALKGLIEKGYVRPIPGILEGTPQGYEMA